MHKKSNTVVSPNTGITIFFEREQAQILINFINVAVMARGLEAAEAGLVLAKIIQKSLGEK